MKFPKFSNKDWSGWAVIVCIGVTLFVLLSNISSVIAILARIIGYFRPVILGVIIAYIISPLAKLFFYRAFCAAHVRVFPFGRNAAAAADQEHRHVLAEF